MSLSRVSPGKTFPQGTNSHMSPLGTQDRRDSGERVPCQALLRGPAYWDKPLSSSLPFPRVTRLMAKPPALPQPLPPAPPRCHLLQLRGSASYCCSDTWAQASNLKMKQRELVAASAPTVGAGQKSLHLYDCEQADISHSKEHSQGRCKPGWMKPHS